MGEERGHFYKPHPVAKLRLHSGTYKPSPTLSGKAVLRPAVFPLPWAPNNLHANRIHSSVCSYHCEMSLSSSASRVWANHPLTWSVYRDGGQSDRWSMIDSPAQHERKLSFPVPARVRLWLTSEVPSLCLPLSLAGLCSCSFYLLFVEPWLATRAHKGDIF